MIEYERKYECVNFEWNLSYDLSLIDEEAVEDIHSLLNEGYMFLEVNPLEYNSDGRLTKMDLVFDYDENNKGKEYVVSIVAEALLSSATPGRGASYKAIRYFEKTFLKEFSYYPCVSSAVPPWSVKGYKFVGVIPFAFGARGSLIASVAFYEKGEDVKIY